jgi:hypothetical protein
MGGDRVGDDPSFPDGRMFQLGPLPLAQPRRRQPKSYWYLVSRVMRPMTQFTAQLGGKVLDRGAQILGSQMRIALCHSNLGMAE